MCLSVYLFYIDRIIEWFAGKDIIKNGKNATKTGAEILPRAVKCPYMTEKYWNLTIYSCAGKEKML